jgi:ketosteroid isomerase-like protein
MQTTLHTWARQEDSISAGKRSRKLGAHPDADGKEQKVMIRATNLFRKEGGDWKMIGHHTDLLPHLQN